MRTSVAPGWSRFRHARQAGWRMTAHLIRRSVAPEHRQGSGEREARVRAIVALDAEPAEPAACRVLDVGCAEAR